MHCKMLSRAPRPIPTRHHSSPPLQQPKMSPDITRCPWGTWLTLFENHYVCSVYASLRKLILAVEHTRRAVCHPQSMRTVDC
jgi:hypothetical protein